MVKPHGCWAIPSVVAAVLVTGHGSAAAEPVKPIFDLSKDKVLYCVGYAHLDTQWRWDFCTTIDRFVRDTLEQNFARFEKFPGYTFNFTGSVRYEMMQEYYPALYAKLKGHVAAGRWFVSGSSVDEGDVNVPSAEAVIRQVLYGNQFFRREFGKESVDFMLPDCFGFPASMPSIWAHCGLKGFSTQKLTWGSAVGIPFKVGVWEGLDGASVLAALDPGPYVGAIKGAVHENADWLARIEQNGTKYGVWADYHYYGVGDQGGAPLEEDVANYLASANTNGAPFKVALVSSDQMWKDITPDQKARLPRYKGDLLLTEHSAGTLTSQAYMKRWNRKNEQLADAAERAAVAAHWLGGAAYPREKLYKSWVRALANQMHDILPGTSIPRAYTYSWNDELVGMNGFAAVLQDSIGAIARALDTRCEGQALVVYNPLAQPREDLVESTVEYDAAAPKAVRVFDPEGREAPSQVLKRTDRTVTVLFAANVAPLSVSVFDVRPADSVFSESDWPADVPQSGVALASFRPEGPNYASPGQRPGSSTAPVMKALKGRAMATAHRQALGDQRSRLSISDSALENEHYRVSVNGDGEVSSIIDKAAGGREILAAPHRLVFTYERPKQYPAWNMDWADRQKPPTGFIGGPAEVRVVERGPVRVALEVKRRGRDSIVTQHIRLARGEAGRTVEFKTDIDWQSTECTLKASFPLSVSNPKATYNWGMGTIERGNNEPTKYEVPSHEWLDLTDAKGDYGVSILEDCKFGSDKPSDNEVRLTLLYTPGVRRGFRDQHSQDWGRHEMNYALHGHKGDWRDARSEWHGRRLNQPLRVFQSPSHPGSLGKSWSWLHVNTEQVDVRAVKLAEEGDYVIVRLQELWGRPAERVVVSLGYAADAYEVDGQERKIGSATIEDGKLVVSMTPFSPRSFAVRLGQSPAELVTPASRAVALPYDTDVVSADGAFGDGSFDAEGRTLPAEMLPRKLVSEGIAFDLGPTGPGENNAVTCKGQSVPLPPGDFDRVYLLAAATEDVRAEFRIAGKPRPLDVQAWTGFVGQFDDRVWDQEFGEIDFVCEGKVVGFKPGFIKRDPIAWFATHRHHPTKGNESYQFSYLFKYSIDLPAGASTLTLPDDPRVKLLAVSVARNENDTLRPAAPLYDDFTGRGPLALRHVYPPEPPPVFEGVTPTAKAVTERREDFNFAWGQPASDDYAGASNGRAFGYFDCGGDCPPHWECGAKDGKLPRLNDGEIARSDDDTQRSAWYDNEGRFYLDLQSSVKVERVNAYSWHKAERAPQFYSLWASNAEAMPDPGFKDAKAAGWTLLAVVKTKDLGAGGVHGSTISGSDGPLGPYRWLLWVTEDVGNGTFFSEIDVHVSE